MWHRYNNGSYGEHKDGSGFDGTGHGRGFPLLTGERGHYGLCASEDVMPDIEAMMPMSNAVGLMPEQVWDADPIPEHGPYPGKPIGSAMPQVWTHAEFPKLCHSLAVGPLYVAVTAPALVHFSINGWRGIRDIDTEDALLGVHMAKLPADTSNPGDTIEFTFFWPESGKWEGEKFEVAIEG